MKIEDRIFDRLRSDADITARVGDRIFPVWAPMDTKGQLEPRPFIVFTRVSGMSVNAMDGPTEDTECRFQFDVIADAYTDGKGIATLVRNRLNGWRDVASLPQVHSSHLQNEFDAVESPTSGTDRPIFRTTQDYLIWYFENG